jgi:hypothetical protein
MASSHELPTCINLPEVCVCGWVCVSVCLSVCLSVKATAEDHKSITGVLGWLERGLSSEKGEGSIKSEHSVKREPADAPPSMLAPPPVVTTCKHGLPIMVPPAIASHFAETPLIATAPGASPGAAKGASSSWMSAEDELVLQMSSKFPCAPPGHQAIAARAAGKPTTPKVPGPQNAPLKKPRLAAATHEETDLPVTTNSAKRPGSKGSPAAKKAAAKSSPAVKKTAVKKSPAVKTTDAEHPRELNMSKKNVCSRAYHGKLNECLKSGMTTEDSKEAARVSYQTANEKFTQ